MVAVVAMSFIGQLGLGAPGTGQAFVFHRLGQAHDTM
jgi:hypothetical protein